MAKVYELNIKLKDQILKGIPVEEVSKFDSLEDGSLFNIGYIMQLNQTEVTQDDIASTVNYLDDCVDILNLMKFNIPKMIDTIEKDKECQNITDMLNRLSNEVHYMWYITDGLTTYYIKPETIVKMNILSGIQDNMRDLREKFASTILELQYNRAFSDFHMEYLDDDYDFEDKDEYINSIIWLCPEGHSNTGNSGQLPMGLPCDFDADRLDEIGLNHNYMQHLQKNTVDEVLQGKEGDGFNFNKRLDGVLDKIYSGSKDTRFIINGLISDTNAYNLMALYECDKYYRIMLKPNICSSSLSDIKHLNIRPIFPPHLISEVLSYDNDFITEVRANNSGTKLEMNKLEELFKERQEQYRDEYLHGGDYICIIESTSKVTFVPSKYLARVNDIFDSVIYE